MSQAPGIYWNAHFYLGISTISIQGLSVFSDFSEYWFQLILEAAKLCTNNCRSKI